MGVRAYAFSVGYMLRARRWLLRSGAPGWPTLYEAWARSLCASGPRAARAALSGRLAPTDALQLLVDNGAAFDARERLFACARSSIDISTYYIQADETGWRSARALADSARRGVRVRLLLDRYMLLLKWRDAPDAPALVHLLRQAGVEVRLWHDAARPFDSNHRKILIVDGSEALVGGRNFADHYRLDGWRDVDLLLRGPSVAGLVAVFEGAWGSAPVLSGPAYGPWFDYRPAAVLSDVTARFALACIMAADRTLDLELAYLVGPGLLTVYLVRAAQRGVRVRVLTNSAESNDLPYTNYALYAAVCVLLEGGVEVYARRGRGRTLHSKYLVADGRWVSFGSHNLDYYSSRFCCETNLQVDASGLAQQLGACFEGGLAQAQAMRLRDEVVPFVRRAQALRAFDRLFRDFQ